MAAGRRRLKPVRILLLIVVALLVIITALPLWFPWVLRPVAKQFGGSYAEYHREGYRRFRLTNVSFTNSSGQFQARHAEALIPTIWLWRHWFGAGSENFAEVSS